MTKSSLFSALAEAQRCLLSFDRYSTPADWIEAVGETIAPVMKTDSIYFVAPASETWERRGANGIEVFAPTLDDDFVAGIESDFVGFAPSGHSVFSESYSTMLHRMVHSAGPAAIHDAPLFEERARKELRLQSEVFDRVSILRQLALSVPEERGEALLVFGYSEGRVPDQGSEACAALELLLPAYREALRLRRSQGNLDTLLAHFEAVPVPMLVVSERAAWDNRAFVRIGLGPLELSALRQSCVALGRTLAKTAGSASPSPHGRTYSSVYHAGRVELRLSARLVEHANQLLGLVQVDRAHTIPPYADVRVRFGLTPTEYAVAELMARGSADKDIAARLGVSYHTARQRVASVLKKTDAPRSELDTKLWRAFCADDTP